MEIPRFPGPTRRIGGRFPDAAARNADPEKGDSALVLRADWGTKPPDKGTAWMTPYTI